MNEENATKPLGQRVKEWFESEGYPLEFRVAHAFEENGFVSHQGHYVTDEQEQQPREIDVVADMNVELDGGALLRVSHVIECKWSKDKPWVVFTSPRSRMAESACIAQTPGSPLGEAVMYCLAGERELHPLELFKTPERGGFSGRRAFEKQDKEKYDQFYRTMQGVATAARAEGSRYAIGKSSANEALRIGVIIFPIIAIDAQLFEAYYDADADEVKVSEIDHVRIYWRGSQSTRRAITPVDIVTARVMSDFARARGLEITALMTAAEQAIRRIQKAFEKHSFAELQLKPAPRGYVGLPPLLRDLHRLVEGGIEKAPELSS